MSTKSSNSQASATDIILDAIATYGGKQKSTKDSRLIICPYHDDRTPSLNINISKPGFKVGTFHCWGCDESGNWNKLAEKLGLPKIAKWQTEEATMHEISKDREQALLGVDMFKTKPFADALGVDEIQHWQDNKMWRGFNGDLLHEIGCQFVIDRRTDEPHLMCVVKMHGKIVGAIKAILEKKYKKQLSYITSPGAWVKDRGIFPFDHVRKMVKKHRYRFIILVEGPRDALRLIAEGLPAVAILGANNIGQKKLLNILSIGDIQHVFTMPDNDKGGKLMHELVKEKDDKGELIPMDPCSAPKHIIKSVKKSLREMGLL